MKATREKLGTTASYSRPRVSNDTPFCEALFRTCKYRPDLPNQTGRTRLADQAICREGRCTGLCEIVPQLVKWRVPPQHGPIRHPQRGP